MNPYLITYERGNGYHCGCCRQTWTETDTMEFENDAAAIEHAKSFNGNNEKSYNEDADCVITHIYALANINPIF